MVVLLEPLRDLVVGDLHPPEEPGVLTVVEVVLPGCPPRIVADIAHGLGHRGRGRGCRGVGLGSLVRGGGDGQAAVEDGHGVGAPERGEGQHLEGSLPGTGGGAVSVM